MTSSRGLIYFMNMAYYYALETRPWLRQEVMGLDTGYQSFRQLNKYLAVIGKAKSLNWTFLTFFVIVMGIQQSQIFDSSTCLLLASANKSRFWPRY